MAHLMSSSTAAPPILRYPWFTAGDLNGFFGLMIDNMTVLSFLAGLLIMGFLWFRPSGVLPEPRHVVPESRDL